MNLSLKNARIRNRHFFALDIFIGCFTTSIALFLRLDGVSTHYIPGLIVATILFLIVKQTVFYKLGLYRCYWRYASIDEAEQIIKIIFTSTFLQTVLFYVLYYLPYNPIQNLPRSLPILDGMVTFILLSLARFSLRWFDRKQKKKSNSPHQKTNRVLVVGAGNAGIAIVKSMQQTPERGLRPVAFVDDDREKLGLKIQGVRVLGNRYDIPRIIEREKINKILIAMPSASGETIKSIFDICHDTRVKTITLPSLGELIDRDLRLNSIREVKIEDLLRRKAIQTDLKNVKPFFNKKTVLITGAGGSIGSEISRQILNSLPDEIILLGHGENSIFYIEQELRNVLNNNPQFKTSKPRLITYIADIRSTARLERVFKEFRPNIVFHAAAHKHVPLMELNPAEAITNNVRGTRNLLDMAVKYDVENLVMISSDKAVNPTNVMGATKRAAEMLVLDTAKKHNKSFVVVRFGNVLGSRGSVIPTFKSQIAAGGPVTVTHRDITRYFITIPEAVQLTLQALLMNNRGEIFMLNMGESVKILDLAKEMIRLSGYKSGRDIEIKFTGLRPGEKLFEEMFHEDENYLPTDSNQIFVCADAKHAIHPHLDTILPELFDAAYRNDRPLITNLLKKLVPGYHTNTYSKEKVSTYSHLLSTKNLLNNVSDSQPVLENESDSKIS